MMLNLNRLCAGLLCLLLAGTAAIHAAEEDQAALAGRILQAVNRPVALAHLPRSGDGRLAMGLLEGDRIRRLHGQERNYAAVQTARRRADEAGVYGRRAWFDQGSLERLWPAANSCDLVVLTDLKQIELTPALAAEIKRVLLGWHGVAILGHAGGGGLDAEALSAWAGTIAGQVEPFAGGGALVKVTADPLAGADDWPAWWRGPDNNCVSADTALKLPNSLQFAAKPFFGPSRSETAIVAHGRLYVMWNGSGLDTNAGWLSFAGISEAEMDKGPILTAQSAGTGIRLWWRRLSEAAWMQTARSVMVADGRTLFVADGNTVLELDGATGTELRRMPVDVEEIKWMMLAEGKLLVLGGTRMVTYGQRSRKNALPFRTSGLHLFAWDREKLKPLWRVDRETGKDAFDPRTPAIKNGRLFICSEKDVAEAIGLETGKQLWRTEVGFERKWDKEGSNLDHDNKVGQFLFDYSSRHPVAGYAVLGLYIISGTEMAQAQALSQQDGRKIWDLDTPRQHQLCPVAFDDQLLAKVNFWDSWGSSLDPATGTKTRAQVKLLVEGCARPTMAPFGMGEPFEVAETLKGACLSGVFTANGLFWKIYTPCVRCMDWRGCIARSNREELPLPEERLFVSDPSGSDAAAELPGWLQYRANAERGSSVPFHVPAEAKLCWETPPLHESGLQSGHWRSRPPTVLMDPEFVPTQPLTIGDRIVVGRADGGVEALDLKTGERLWRARTSGRIHSAPAIWRDRVLAGSTDGYLYAFALDDGRELWRLRVAPQESRIMVYGQLGSRWPELGAPLVHDGKVTMSAGLVGMLDGVWAVCADARNGRILWERSDWTDTEVTGEHNRMSGCAGFAQYGDELFYHAGLAPPIRVSASDGTCQPVLARTMMQRYGTWHPHRTDTIGAFNSLTGMNKGHEIGALSEHWVIYGGRRLLIDQGEIGTWDNALTFVGRDDKGEGRLPGLRLDRRYPLFPAWDEKDVIFYERPGNDKNRRWAHMTVAVPREKLLAVLEEAMPETSTAEILAGADAHKRKVIVPTDLVVRDVDVSQDGLHRWQTSKTKGDDFCARALTANAVLRGAHIQGKHSIVQALSRHDGKLMWQVDLPVRMVYDGLAVAPDGTVVVSLMDGRIVALGGE